VNIISDVARSVSMTIPRFFYKCSLNLGLTNVLKTKAQYYFKRDYHYYPFHSFNDNKDVNSRKTITKEKREKFWILSFIILQAQIKFHLSTNFVEITLEFSSIISDVQVFPFGLCFLRQHQYPTIIH
jgi:hypothetical protein